MRGSTMWTTLACCLRCACGLEVIGRVVFRSSSGTEISASCFVCCAACPWINRGFCTGTSTGTVEDGKKGARESGEEIHGEERKSQGWTDTGVEGAERKVVAQTTPRQAARARGAAARAAPELCETGHLSGGKKSLDCAFLRSRREELDGVVALPQRPHSGNVIQFFPLCFPGPHGPLLEASNLCLPFPVAVAVYDVLVVGAPKGAASPRSRPTR